MSKKIVKIVRLKITTPIYPTTSWKELKAVFKQLHDEVRIASNQCISYCNIEYSTNPDDKSTFLQKKVLIRSYIE